MWSGSRRLATVTARIEGQGTGAPPVLTVRLIQPLQCSRRDATDIMRAVVHHGRQLQVRHLELDTVDPLVRHQARLAGFAGALRQPLGASLDAVLELSGDESATPDAGAVARQVAVLTSLPVTVRPPRGWLAKLARGAVSGFADMAHLTVQGGDGRPDLTVAFPDRADVIPESVALAIDTVLAIRCRFGTAIDHLRLVSFDHASHALKAGRNSGEAQTNIGTVHLNAWYALAGELDEQRRPNSVPPPELRFVGCALPRYTSVERTAAHEAWHQMERAFEARDYSRSIELRRRLGAHFGVATLEHAVLGRSRDSPPAWRYAQEQLVRQVSDYGGTLPGEATAEMFMLWWCPIVPPSPAVKLFGELVEEYFPASA